ncbi:MAG: sodium:solute symporter family protein [Betaproteobacteria bacterium]|nr:sodium:solute symporter family protein [Betaproteobacteria bacterium]
MLIAFVLLYLAVTIAIGLWAARRVHNSKDYVVAGRSLPLYMNTATVFATWFGAESVLSVSVEFSKSGLGGIIADPFGSSMCLVIVAVFFARAFYRMDLLTIGDFYRKRYGKTMELGTSVVIAISYLGWTAAQLTALGLVFSTLTEGAVSLSNGILISGIVVLAYTIWGGMWSVAMTDLFQSVMIIVGLAIVAWVVGDMAGGPGKVIGAAAEAGKFEFFPKSDLKDWLAFITAFITLAIGSIPQQDIFQRVTSAKNERTAIAGSFLGGVVYFSFVFVPIYIVCAALMVDPGLSSLLSAEDARDMQRILPSFILEHTPMWVRVLFFGALLSAILSTASGAIIAPTSLCTENIIRPRFPHMSDRQFLLTLRIVLVSFTLAALLFALNSKQTMYDMVQNAYTVTLVAALVPLAAGVFWKRASNTGAILSAAFGLIAWLIAAYTAPEATVPPALVGLAFSLFGMVIGSILPREHRSPAHASGEHRAAPTHPHGRQG